MDVLRELPYLKLFFRFLRIFFPLFVQGVGVLYLPPEGAAGSADMSKKLPRCEACHLPFRPDRFNVDRQKHCRRRCCVQARKRLRQRLYHATRRAEDPQFRAAENARCAAANRRRRERQKQEARAAPPSDGRDDTPALRYVVTGLLSQVTDTSDPRELQQHLALYAARGRRLAAPAPTGTDPP